MHIAFIGLGAMGAPMAANIARGEVQLTVFNRDQTKARQLQDLGAQIADTPGSAAQRAEVVCTCVSNPDALRTVLLGDDGAIPAASSGTLFIDFSTVDPATSKDIEAACDSVGCTFVEAPVSGGVAGAKSGQLTIIVGADVEAFERALPVLELVGTQITHVGRVGTGSMLKLINQMLVGVNLAAVLEAFILAQRAGIDPAILFEIVRNSSGNSAMLNRALPGNLAKRNFDPGFTLGLLLKDLGLVSDWAKSLGISLSMMSTARGIYEEGERSGLQNLDMTAAVLPMEREYGIDNAGTDK